MLANPMKAIRETFVAGGAERVIRDAFDGAGVTIGGPAPHDPQVHAPAFYERVLRDGTIGLGESYMDGEWDCEALDVFATMLLDGKVHEQARTSPRTLLYGAAARALNLQSVARAFDNGQRHYDIGTDLYTRMLDPRMLYTCAYWQDGDTLASAQERKLELVCRKVGLRPGMKVLELGCGWGGFAEYAAKQHGCQVTGYTVSKDQAALARERNAGLPVEILLDDYRSARGRYDAVVSIGIMEHVGYKNYRTYMEVVDRCLAPGGVAFVHTIGGNLSRKLMNGWFHKYIFPGALLPSVAQLGAAMEGLFVLEDLHNIGPHYDPTLMAWHERFERGWPELAEKYGERFRRMWRFYLLTSAAGFRARYTQLFQLVFTRTGTRQPACRRS